MTNEEKAKAYGEALKTATDAHKDTDKHLKATLERIFPELRESKDEKTRKQLISICNEWLGGGFNARPCLDDVRWLKNLLETQKELTPADWSEEDEFFRQQLIVYCEKCVQDTLAAKCVDWLKSLRPQSHWKPSEEQMEALEIAERWYSDNMGCNLDLVSLCEQLKKLM